MTVSPDVFREALAHWASGITIVAVRQPERVIATTVSAFMSLSVEPALVLLALGPNATVRPFLTAGERFGVSILSAAQRRLATIFADPFPVGPDPFVPDGPPVLHNALVGLHCCVSEVRDGGDHLIVTAAVDDIRLDTGEDPLIRYYRSYHRLDG